MDPITSREFLKLGTRDFDNGAVREAIYKAIKRGEGEARPLRWRTGPVPEDQREDEFLVRGRYEKGARAVVEGYLVDDDDEYIPISDIPGLVEG